MCTSIWLSVMTEFDKEMAKQNRKVILFVDNAACHKVTTKLHNVRIEFLPPNTTSLIQPLDQGIIRSFKSYYRNIMVRKQLIAIEKGLNVRDFMKSITLLDVLHFVKRSWWLVKSDTIKHCFQKAKLSLDASYVEDEGSLETIIDSQLGLSQTEFDEYVACDNNLECYGQQTDEEIIREITEKIFKSTLLIKNP